MNHDKLQLRDPIIGPTNDMLRIVLDSSFAAYEQLQDALPGLDVEQEWQWYTPYKAWFARGQHRWTTSRGAKKEKTLYWLHVCEGSFCVAVWFKSKNREEALNAAVSEKTKQLIAAADTMGKMPTFPVVFEVTGAQPLVDICTLINLKKRIEA